jgi:hypothetical protein
MSHASAPVIGIREFKWHWNGAPAGQITPSPVSYKSPVLINFARCEVRHAPQQTTPSFDYLVGASERVQAV